MGAQKWVESPSGYLELIDTETNTVLARQSRSKPPRSRLGNRAPGRPTKEQVTALTQQQSKTHAPEIPRGIYDFNPTVAEKICNAVTEGARISLLGLEQGFPPYSVICRWRRTNREFNEQILIALQCRTLYWEERVLEIAERLSESPHPRAVKIAVKAFQWLAAQNDPEKYGRKGRVPETNSQSVRIQVAVPPTDATIDESDN